ncbi:hypothetical protein MUP51_08310, partial [Candidatus Bathyarchaeota archaeon]|nr:hypothetical protein [Candidatus Bathyarchaeota archaeon]
LVMWGPIAILVAIMLGVSALGLVGQIYPGLNPETFIEVQIEHALHAIMPPGVELHVPHIEFGLKSQAWSLSAFLLAVGIVSGKTFYWGRKGDEWNVERTGWRAPVYKFLWNRWYMNQLYYKVFVDGFINLGRNTYNVLEKGVFDKITPVVSGFFINLGINLYDSLEQEVLDKGINKGIPSLFTSIYNHLKKLQTGVLSYNIAYMVFIFLFLIIVLMKFGGMI